ncbi:MAG: hypothetical protein IJM30_12980 [Thermoguttaceae bacterium]|nr:hypothetical protein [Thermoguttaceae bacterium]
MKPKRNVRDSVFTDMLSRKKYALRMYKALHPEDLDVTEKDVRIVTLKRVFTNGRYNDFAMEVKDKFLIMVEAQSTWSDNVVVRMFVYLGLYWTRVFAGKSGRKLYYEDKIELPVPETYVLYSGKRGKKIPKRISLRELFFENDPNAPDLVARVISGNPDAKTKTIIDEFAFFERAFMEQLGNKEIPVEEAILNTIGVCLQAGVLAEYLNETRGEVENVMKRSSDYDLEILARVDEAVEKTKKRMKKAADRRVAKLTEENAARVAKLTEEADARAASERLAGERDQSITIAKRLLALGTTPVSQIARITGLSRASVNKLARAI